MKEQDLDFENWFGVFTDILKKYHKYQGPIDQDLAMEYWLAGTPPEHAVDEMYTKKLKGIELIAEERQEQIEKHGRTIEKDVIFNKDCQLAFAAACIIENTDITWPEDWSTEFRHKMKTSTYKKRLIVAGALIAAEIDRIQAT